MNSNSKDIRDEAIVSFESEMYDLMVYVMEYDPGCDAIIRMDPADSFPPEPEEIDYVLFDLKGNYVSVDDIQLSEDYPEWDDVDEDILGEIREYMAVDEFDPF